MVTAKEGGATAPTTTSSTSSYGGEGGAGGKFRRKPFRKPTTPYDRPAIGNSSLLTKLVDPASRLISYGARRFFDSILRKRLPPPPPAQIIPESNHVMSDGLPEPVPSDPEGGECSQPIRISGSNGISDLEQLLKQKTFTRSEIDHLIELLHSRGEVPLRDNGERNEETVPSSGTLQRIESGLMVANRGDKHHVVVSPPISNSKVLGDSIASPAELAKSYMGSRPSKLSPSVLSNHSGAPREDTRLLNNMRTASKSVSVSLAMTAVVGSGSPENGHIKKPSSLRRSAIYNMSRSPYLKTLKRRSSVLDEQDESVGSIRRIRQKSNLIALGVPHTDQEGSNSDSILVSPKQILPLIDESRHVQRTEENNDISIPSTSYAIVPYESNGAEVVVRRSGNVENIAFKDRSESKVVDLRQKSPLKLASKLRGQDLKIMENVVYSELPMNMQDDHKFDSNAGLLDACDTPQEQAKAEENGPVKTSAPSNAYYPVINNDSAVSFETSLVRDGASDHVKSGLSKHQKRAAFRMSALEDYVDLDDDLPCNGIASRPFSEGRGLLKAHFTDSKFSPPEEPKVLKSAIQPILKSPSNLMSSQTIEVGGVSSLGEGSNGIVTPASEVTAAAPPIVPSLPVAASEKPKEINNPQALIWFSSKVGDKSPSESRCRTAESSSSLLDASAPTSSLLKVVDPENAGCLKPLAAEDSIGKFDTVDPAMSFTAATSNNNTHQISTFAPVIFTTSVSVSDSVPSGTGSISSATSSGVIFGAAEAPKVSGEPAFKFGMSPDPSAHVSATSATIIPAGDLKIKSLTDSNSGILGSSSTEFVAFGAPSSGNMTSGLSSLINVSSANNSQGSQFSSASKSFVPTVGTVSQGTSDKLFSLASQPSSNSNSGASSASSLSSSQVFSPIMSFGVSSSASSSDTGAVVSSGGSTSSFFGVNPSAASVGSAGASSSFTTSVFSFGVNSSSSSINAIGSTGGAAASGFSFGVNSSGSAPVTTSFFSSSSSSSGAVGSTAGIAPSGFSFGVSSSSSAPVATSFFSGSSSSSGAVGSTGGIAPSGFSFGASTSGSVPVTTSFFSGSSSSSSAVGSTGGIAPSVFSFGLSSPASTSVSNAASSFSNGASGVFKFGGSSSASSSAINSSSTSSNAFGSSLQAPTSLVFGSSPATGFSFGATATSSAPANSTHAVFNSSTAPSLSSPFSFTSTPASVFSSPSRASAQPVFGNPGSSPGSNYQMSAEDSMAEDPVQSTAPSSVPVFGQGNISPTPGFMFGSSQPNPFQFGGQQNQGVPQNPSMFQGSGSVEFNAGGSFSLGSTGGDKSGRKYVKASRSKNRKK